MSAKNGEMRAEHERRECVDAALRSCALLAFPEPIFEGLTTVGHVDIVIQRKLADGVLRCW